MSYNTLFIEFPLVEHGKTSIFTQTGNFSKESKDYRWNMYCRWNKLDWRTVCSKDETKLGYLVNCDSQDECYKLQRAFHDIFKVYYDAGHGRVTLPGNVKGETVVTWLNMIRAELKREDFRQWRSRIFEGLMKYFPKDIKKGLVYLIKVTKGNKVLYKIGSTCDFEGKRKEELLAHFRADNIEVVDIKESDRALYDEAHIQLNCFEHKADETFTLRLNNCYNGCCELYELHDDILKEWHRYWQD